MDLESFYNSILNIGNKDKYNDIVKIVKEEKARLLENTDSLDGFCKYLANQIKYEIKTNLSGVWVNSIDLNELVQVDHVVLLAEYHNNDDMKKELAQYRMETAKDDLRAAKILLDAGEYKAANNRAYYAIFHAINAVHATAEGFGKLVEK